VSRGFGMWQRWLLHTIKRHGKPMTFEEIERAVLDQAGAPPGVRLNPSPTRSMRRALHGLVKDGSLVALGIGGRAEPHRYFLSVMALGLICGAGNEYEAIIAGLDERDVMAMSAAMQRQMTSPKSGTQAA
jgi:hypothetical protein